jgi:transposase
MKKRSSSRKQQKPTMRRKARKEGVRIGMDLGDKTSRYCVLSKDGGILHEREVPTTKAGMAEAFGSFGRARIAVEVGTHSPWVSRLLQGLGHEIVVANPKQVKLITESTRKTIDWTLKRWHDWRESIRSCCGRFSTAAIRRKPL